MSKIKLLPWANILTFAALFFCCLAIYSLIGGRYYLALLLNFIGFIFDFLDGYVARKLHQQSKIGRQLDGQVDTLVHLFFPGLFTVLYFHYERPIDLSIIFIFLTSGIYRLARFSTTGFVEKGDIKYYQGLPVFVNNFILLIFILLNIPNFILSPVFLIISYLMVQKFNFPKPGLVTSVVFLLGGLILILLKIYGN
jgi:CDP-diacylglycerol--serine O-phosphatidyltransferase